MPAIATGAACAIAIASEEQLQSRVRNNCNRARRTIAIVREEQLRLQVGGVELRSHLGQRDVRRLPHIPNPGSLT